MPSYVAFLRGINVGGNKLISMEDLKRAFSSVGFKNVQTVLASGNIVFQTDKSALAALTEKLEQKLTTAFGAPITVLLRTAEQIHALIKLKPFANAKIAPQTRLHVSFLPEDTKHGLKVSQRLKGTDFDVLRASPGELCSVVLPTQGTTDLMKVLEKEFGKRLTTRSWNTVEKIAKLLEA